MKALSQSKTSLPQRLTLLISALLFVFNLLLALTGERTVSGQVTISEINPTQSTLDASDPDGASGGRINGLAAVAGNNNAFYAATEWGGLYQTTDGGVNWTRLNNHRPTVTWDMEVSPADANRVYATSFFDGRVNSLAGINVSTDGGATWAKPATATPPVGFCASAARRDEPSAFGIAIDPATPQNVYIGTNCGLAISTNNGVTWTFVDPTPGDGADDIWDVVVHHGGIIDLVGDDGHRRSIDGGANWTTATSNPLPSGIGSITVSPDESYVLFAVMGTSIFESDNGGTSWDTTFVNPSPQGRIPFVVTNNRSGTAFDMWFGDTSLHRAGCTTPAMPAPGGAARCPASGAWAGPFTRAVGGHDDTGDLAFDTIAADDKCPRLMSSDGGVYRNTNTVSPGCHTPAWEQPTVTPRALWLFGMAGANQGGVTTEDLYFGCQDNGTFAATDAGAVTPTWSNRQCCDGFDDAAEPNRVAYTVCCFSPGRSNRLFVRNQGMTGGGELNTYPPGNLPGFRAPDIIANYAANSYVLLTTSGVFLTPNIGAGAVVWTQIGAATTPAGACAVRAAQFGGIPSFFAQTGNCDGGNADRLWRYNGTAPGGTWTEIARPGNVGGFGVIAVDPNNPNRILASHLNGLAVNMVMTVDGGANWTTLGALNTLMTGGGTFLYRNQRGPTNFTGFGGYPQPTLVAFDPEDTNILVAGGADSGVFFSSNAGSTWTAMTNNSGNAANPIIPRPQFAYFDHETAAPNIYIGTQGRGVWRFTPINPPTISSNNVPVKAGSNAASFSIATAADADQAANTLGITINGNPTTASSNGVTVSNVAIQPSGDVTANIATTCAATTAMFTLVVTDSQNVTGTGTLTVTVIPNMPPMLAYNPQTVVAGTTPSFNPATGPSDNGTIDPLVLQSIVPGTGLTLSLNPASGQIAVTSATLIGNYTVTVLATDNCGATTPASFVVTVICPTITFVPATLPNGVQSTAYNQVVTATPPGTTYTYAVTTNVLPPGLLLNPATGAITGIPSAPGNYTFNISATGWGGCVKSQSYNLLITGTCETITVNPTTLPNGTLGTPYPAASVSATGGAAPHTFAVTQGALPTGLTLNGTTGAITGTPTAVGSFSFRVSATAVGGCTGSRQYVVSIACSPLTFAPAGPALPNGAKNVAYNQALTVSPGTGYTFSIQTGNVPPGYSLSPGGVLSGITNQAGTWTFTVRAQAGGCQATKLYTLTIPNTLAPTALAQLNDYDGDAKSDLALFAANGEWRLQRSSDQKSQTVLWGTAGDLPLSGDYDGDGRTDIAVFRPSDGTWYVKRSSDGNALVKAWGLGTDVPVPGDYDGDGKTDIAVWRGGEGNWYILRSSDQQFEIANWGLSLAPFNDVPVVGDYDGDGKTDLGVFRRANGVWYVRQSSNGNLLLKRWGLGTDVPVVNDYDGDGKVDLAVWRGVTGTWYVQESASGATRATAWGAGFAPYNDQAVPGDYDGDGQADFAVWRPGDATWYLSLSGPGNASATRVVKLGESGDRPVSTRQP